jgi:hypothetical protein
VPINEWWAGDASQRFWMEITDRHDLGADLFAPTLDGGGRSYWGYELITYVQPGDIVFHWHKSLAGEPGIVGWSLATGAYEDTDIEWQAQGTVGRAKGNLRPRPAWRMPLLNYTALPNPVLISQARAEEKRLRRVLADLEAAYPGTLYFPFGFSDKRALRAQQTYFVKMPHEVLEVLGLPGDEFPEGPSRGSAPATGKSAKSKGSGYIADAVVRSAIEWHAVNSATRHYEDEGFTVVYTGASKPYDLEVTKGSDERRVEVKGSSGAADTVELTHGEVTNSRKTVPTDLYVVDGVGWAREPDGTVSTWGGDVRLWENWTAAESHLKAIRFRYTLPTGAVLP